MAHFITREYHFAMFGALGTGIINMVRRNGMKYQIQGDPMPVVICELQSGETMISEAGAMAWMTNNMKMETSGGGAGKMLGRMFSGESMFQNRYTAQGGEGMIAFASSFPGSIRAVEIGPGREIIIQKRAFLASETGVDLSTYLQKKLSTGLFGGEGFIMQKVSGSGTVFLEMDGSIVEYDLAAGQQLVVQTGSLAMMDASCNMEIQTIKGVKNVLFGGEGMFNTVVTGPGRVVLQSMPLSSFVQSISSMMPSVSS